jgi:hypothetical protein
VDILILDSPYDLETIKWRMAEENPHFYLIDAKTPGADWKVLWYRPTGENFYGRPPAIKIDILLPGTAMLPSFDPYWIEYDNTHGLPTAPLLLVLHKVLGWRARINSPDNYHYQKHWDDACDVANLVPLASQVGVTIDDGVLPDDFIDIASEWVNEFIAEYPKFRIQNHWRKIGFRTSCECKYYSNAEPLYYTIMLSNENRASCHTTTRQRYLE